MSCGWGSRISRCRRTARARRRGATRSSSREPSTIRSGRSRTTGWSSTTSGRWPRRSRGARDPWNRGPASASLASGGEPATGDTPGSASGRRRSLGAPALRAHRFGRHGRGCRARGPGGGRGHHGQSISTHLLRLLHKFAHHAESGTSAARTRRSPSLRENIAQLIAHWELDDPNPGAYTAVLEGMVRRPRRRSQSSPPRSPARPSW